MARQGSPVYSLWLLAAVLSLSCGHAFVAPALRGSASLLLRNRGCTFASKAAKPPSHAKRAGLTSVAMGDSLDGGLGKEFDKERETREKMDKIFKDASSDLESLAKAELEALNEETDELIARRQEEWEAMGSKAAESLTSKVDSLAENFLKSTGRSASDDDDELDGLQRYMGPEKVAVIGNAGPLRDEIIAKVGERPALSVTSCEKLLETRGINLEDTDTLIFCGDTDALDRYTVERLMGRATKLRFVVLLSSLGTRRSDQFPFTITNAFSGILDKKRDLELGIQELSKEQGFAYTIIRMGKVEAKSGLDGVKIQYGDEMTEEISPSSAAESVLQSILLQPTALNNTMSIISVAGKPPTQGDWDDEFLRLDGPELWRSSLGSVSVEACRDWVKTAWASKWIKSGSGLTTPVAIKETQTGVQLVFTPAKSNYVSFKEEKQKEKAREKGDEDDAKDKPKKVGDMEGGIEVSVEERPFPRVRAMRCNMAEETVIKETSEKIMMSSLKKDVEGWIKSQ
eukprot:CAMPEP_0181321812 /NCGR_PEP_ID=MMETSP1101-20121128/18895_1 /TAXON_ID=46948 /ORGANISM="Rhodomonas abbreviata, Strain Caron Lab Isolate" /LENGTH=513 /DNA_ID=CAMNT_0023429685 /DNA_START=28 /DNA_END=1569 /DNA_ORIENTATION=+